MKLFNLVNSKVTIEPEVLLLAPFAAIWESDKSKDKTKAMLELSYIWFMEDIKSDFFEELDRVERHKAIVSALELPIKWKPNKLVKKASIFYVEMSKSLTYNLLLDSRSGLDKLSKMLRDPDFTKIDIKKVADTIKTLPLLIDSLKKLEETVLKEKVASSHIGSQDKAIFEDGA